MKYAIFYMADEWLSAEPKIGLMYSRVYQDRKSAEDMIGELQAGGYVVTYWVIEFQDPSVSDPREDGLS